MHRLKAIREYILARRALFARQGTVVTTWRGRGEGRCGPYYSVVYREAGRKRGIYLGRATDLADGVRALLAEVQAPRDNRDQLRRLIANARAALRRQYAELNRELAAVGYRLKGREIRPLRTALDRTLSEFTCSPGRVARSLSRRAANMAIETTMRGLMAELRQEGERVEVRGVVSQHSAVASREGIVVTSFPIPDPQPLTPEGEHGGLEWKNPQVVSQIAASGQSPGNSGPSRVDSERKATPPEGGTTNEQAARPPSSSSLSTAHYPLSTSSLPPDGEGHGGSDWKKHGSVSQIADSGQSAGNSGPWRVEDEQKATPPEGGTTNEPAERPRSSSSLSFNRCPLLILPLDPQ